MSGNHRRARARVDGLERSAEDQAAAIAWIDEELAIRAAEDRYAGRVKRAESGRPSTDEDLFAREFVVEAYLAGREQSWLVSTIGRAVALLGEAASMFRDYETIARNDLAGRGVEPASPATRAGRNGQIAERSQAVLP